MKRQAKKLQKKSRTHQVNLTEHKGAFQVQSGSSGNKYYVTEMANGAFRCSCKWAQYHRDGECSHTISVREWLAQAGNLSMAAWASKEEIARSRHRHEGDNQGVWFTSRKAIA